MKKLVLTTVCALAMAGAAFAQGTVTWTSISPAGFTAQTNAVTFSPLFGGGASGLAGATVGNTANVANTFFYEMLYLGGSQVSAPTTLAGLQAWHDAGLSGVNSGTGRATVSNPNTTAATVPWLTGTTDNIVLVGWSANLGSTWLTVSNELFTGSYISVLAGVNGFFGISVAGFMSPNGGDPGQTFIGGGANAGGTPIQNTLMPMFLLPVPEPTTLALAGLGGLSLMLFRRQRK